MIQDIVTFMGAQGHRIAEIGFLATCVVTPFYVVDFIDNIAETHFTKFFTDEETAEEAAKLFAFEGVFDDDYAKTK
jgi:hypothetical protein